MVPVFLVVYLYLACCVVQRMEGLLENYAGKVNSRNKLIPGLLRMAQRKHPY